MIGNATGAILPFVVAARFRPGPASDAYFYALGTILYFNSVIALAVESSAAPHVVRIKLLGRRAINRFLIRTELQSVAASSAVTVMGTALVVILVLPGTSFDGEQRHAISDSMILLAPLPLLVTATSILAGAHYAFHKFLLPTCSLASRSLFALIFAFAFGSQLGISSVIYGLLVGELIRLALLSVSIRGLVVGQASRPDPSQVQLDEGRGFWRAAGPQVASMSLSGLSPMVDKTVAATLGAGRVTTMELAQRLVYTPMLLIVSAIGLVVGTSWAEMFTLSDHRSALRRDYWRVQRVMLAISMSFAVVSVAAVWACQPVLRDLLGLSDPSTLVVTYSLLALSIPCAVSANLAVRLHIAAARTRWMPALTIVTVSANLALDVIFAPLMGMAGIALSSVAVMALNAAMYNGMATRLLRASQTSERSAPDTHPGLGTSAADAVDAVELLSDEAAGFGPAEQLVKASQGWSGAA